MATTTGTRKFAPEFKTAAVVRARLGQESITEISTDLGIAPSTLRTWVKQAAPAAAPSKLKETPAAAAPVAQRDPNGCRICGRGPVMDVKLRSVVGMVIAFQWRRVEGKFCRDCGTALAKEVTNKTMLTGWWGLISFFFNWYVVLTDTIALRKFKSLGAPQGEPVAPPVKPGKPMFKRPGVYVATAVLLTTVALAATYGEEKPADSFANHCVAFDAAHTKVRKVKSCSDSHDGKVVGIVSNKDFCPEIADGSIRLKVEDTKVLCIDLDQ